MQVSPGIILQIDPVTATTCRVQAGLNALTVGLSAAEVARRIIEADPNVEEALAYVHCMLKDSGIMGTATVRSGGQIRIEVQGEVLDLVTPGAFNTYEVPFVDGPDAYAALPQLIAAAHLVHAVRARIPEVEVQPNTVGDFVLVYGAAKVVLDDEVLPDIDTVVARLGGPTVEPTPLEFKPRLVP